MITLAWYRAVCVYGAIPVTTRPDQSGLNQGDRATGVRQADGDEHSGCSPAKHYDIEVRHLVIPSSVGSDSLNHDSRAGAGDGVRRE